MAVDDRILIYIARMLNEVNEQIDFINRIEDKSIFKQILIDYLNNHQYTVNKLIHANDDNEMKRFLLNNFIKPNFFKETSSVVKKSQNQQPPIIVEEPKPIRRGRPKGSKNKPKEIITNIPVHSVYDKTFVDAIKDILWYRPGITAKTIVDHLDCDESIIALIYGKIFEYTKVYWRESKIKNRFGKTITLYYPIGERKGYFYDGKLRSITNIAEGISMNKVTLWKRIKSGMNHIEAINKPIDDKMVRNGKNS